MTTALIRIDDRTKARLLKQSLTVDADGNPNETMDSIVRRLLNCLETKKDVKRVNVSRL